MTKMKGMDWMIEIDWSIGTKTKNNTSESDPLGRNP